MKEHEVKESDIIGEQKLKEAQNSIADKLKMIN